MLSRASAEPVSAPEGLDQESLLPLAELLALSAEELLAPSAEELLTTPEAAEPPAAQALEPSAPLIPEPTPTAEPTLVVEPAPTVEPTPTTEPSPTVEPTRSVEPRSEASGPVVAASKHEPPLPRFDVNSGMIWPVPRGREMLRQVPIQEAQLREELIAPPGGEDGSGHSDAFIYKAGGWCLKTSQRRRFALVDSGRAALLMLARAKMLLGPMLLPNTILSIQQDSSGGAWLWTTAPWSPSLRADMNLAAKQGHEQELGKGLRAYAGAAISAMLMVSRSGISLDIHPSNFCLREGQVYYLDDDISLSQHAPGIGYALLYRIEEYLAFPGAIEAYLVALEEALLSKATQEDIEQLGLVEALSQTPLRSAKGRGAIQQIIDVCKRCKRAGNASSNTL